VYECKPVQGAGHGPRHLAIFQFEVFSTELNSFSHLIPSDIGAPFEVELVLSRFANIDFDSILN